MFAFMVLDLVFFQYKGKRLAGNYSGVFQGLPNLPRHAPYFPYME